MHFARLIATFFTLGYIPFAPGTFGAMGAMLLIYLIAAIVQSDAISTCIHLLLIGFFYLTGVWSCRKLQSSWGDDPSKVVVDEAVGYWVGMLFIPAQPSTLIAALVLFRFFDIAKPLGIRSIDRWHNAHAVMLDDVLAGIYTLICMHALIYFEWL
jgi:phosphatidylglycerophosphatase A